MTIIPFEGLARGIVSANNVVPSISVSSPPITEPVTKLSSSTSAVSFAIVGGSFTAFTKMISVSFLQIAGRGVPVSQMLKTTVSVPVKLREGV